MQPNLQEVFAEIPHCVADGEEEMLCFSLREKEKGLSKFNISLRYIKSVILPCTVRSTVREARRYCVSFDVGRLLLKRVCELLSHRSSLDWDSFQITQEMD